MIEQELRGSRRSYISDQGKSFAAGRRSHGDSYTGAIHAATQLHQGANHKVLLGAR
jgi:hypothetical protein